MKGIKSINCVVETPKGYGIKYDYDPRLGRLFVKKRLPAGLVFPFDFGYIPGTMGEDGDPLDVVMISEMQLFPGCSVDCRIIGSLKVVQREKNGRPIRNDRYIAVPVISVTYRAVTEISQLPGNLLQELEVFFITYNRQEGKQLDVVAKMPGARAMAEIKKAEKQAQPGKLIQLLLPLYDAAGKPFPAGYYQRVKDKLVKEFGGVTVYTQSPASGLWKDDDQNIVKDRIIIYEVMAGRSDQAFWHKYKKQLQSKFNQDEIIIRQLEVGLL